MVHGMAGAALAVLAVGGAAMGQCSGTLEAGGFPGVVVSQGAAQYTVGQVMCSVRWDPDGAGPEPSWLVVGGVFNRVDGVTTVNIAGWDGARWHAIGAGLGASPLSEPVMSLAVWNGQLIAGGRFTRSGTGPSLNCIARWDGTLWQPMATGFTSGSPTTVAALAVHANELYAAGSFRPGPIPGQYNVARWNGTQWLPVFQGLGQSVTSLSETHAPVTSLLSHSGSLYAAGSFLLSGAPGRDVAVLVPGQGWSAVGAGVGPAAIYQLQSDGAGLLAVGRMTMNGQVMGNVGRWDGTAWTPLVTQANSSTYSSYARLNGVEYVGINSGTRLGRINAGAVEYVGPELTEPAGTNDTRRTILLGDAAGGVVVGGNFMRTNTADIDWRFLNSLAVWDGGNFSPLSLSPDRSISTFVRYNNDLYALGSFFYVNNRLCNRVARASGASWEPLGDGQGLNARVHCGVEWNGKLVVGGPFTTAGGAAAGHVAAWNGTAWETLGAGVPELAVRRLYNFNGRLLAVCGEFMRITDYATPVLREWNGSAWVLFGDADGSDADVGAVVIHAGEMYVAGRNGAVGTHRWNGSDWVPVQTPNPAVGVVGVWQGNLLGVGEGTHRFVAGAWERLSPFTLSMGFVNDIIEHQGELFVAGQSNAQVPSVMRWNGAGWTNVANMGYNPPGTVNSFASALAVRDGDLLMGGAFGGFVPGAVGIVPALSEIRRTSPPSPVFIDATGDVTVAAGGTQALTVQMLDPNVTAYQWRRDGVNLSDGVQADLSAVSGAGTATLTITNAVPSASAYTVRVTAGTPVCFATSAPMVVTVTPGCDPIDFNRDGLFPDPQDITDFLAVFGGGACPTAACGDVDFNNDGLFPDIADVEAFVGTLGGAACP
ncbi:MAG TPA: hypothetical protein VHN77_10160 [Phycisphaerales bacterium]|nr:hypothetical protein [Phycisphaerales bacterium]